jgi:N-acetylmuramoyl-L-alanine amidase
MPSNQDRNASGTRIAVSLGALVAVVMLAIWGATALAGSIHGGLEPAKTQRRIVKATPVEATKAAEATKGAETTRYAQAEPTKPAVTPAPKPVAKPKPAPAPAPVKPSAAKYVVVIDPGHGGELSGSEPTGPNDSTPHPKTAFGASSASGFTEAQGVLEIALKLRPLLEQRGVKVIMVRTAPKSISNKDRAAIANKANADLFLRLHMDGADGNSSVHGISMQVPAAGWPPLGKSRKAGEIILASLIKETGATNRGIAPRKDLAGFNWCKVPTALPELGFLSNRTEANKLASDSYQQKLAQALADGTMQYLQTVR